jgi:hypothetical protein
MFAKNTQPNNKIVTLNDLNKLESKLLEINNLIENLSQPEIVSWILDLEKDWANILDIAMENSDLGLKTKAEEVKPKLQQLHYDLHQKLEPANKEDLKIAKNKLLKMFFKLKETGFENIQKATAEQKEIVQEIYQILDYDIERGVRNFQEEEVRQMAYKIERKVYNQIFN